MESSASICSLCQISPPVVLLNQNPACQDCAFRVQAELTAATASPEQARMASLFGYGVALLVAWVRWTLSEKAEFDVIFFSLLMPIAMAGAMRLYLSGKRHTKLYRSILIATLLTLLAPAFQGFPFHGGNIFFAILGLIIARAIVAPFPVMLTKLDHPDEKSAAAKSNAYKGAAAGTAVVLAKGKSFLGILKALSFGKFFLTFSSMIVMVLAYARNYGFKFSLGFVLAIFIHEMGHALAAWKLGMKAGAPVFIPFVGAFIALKDQPKSRFQDFVIGAGGPLAGGATGLLLLAYAKFGAGESADLFLSLGYFTLVMNLFNLIPFGMLDGGRMTAPLLRRHWIVGLPVFLGASVWAARESLHFNPFIAIITLFGLVALYRAENAVRRPEHFASTLEKLHYLSRERVRSEGNRLETTQGQRNLAALVYFGWATLLAISVNFFWAQLPPVS